MSADEATLQVLDGAFERIADLREALAWALQYADLDQMPDSIAGEVIGVLQDDRFVFDPALRRAATLGIQVPPDLRMVSSGT